MKDVAREAGVGLKTVSRVVNGEPGVSQTTVTRVRDVIARLGYRRDEAARELRNGQVASIGLILEDSTDPFYAHLVGAVQDVAQSHGMLALTGTSDEDPDAERDLGLALCARRVQGLVIVPAPGADHHYLEPELAAGMAAVFVDRPPVGVRADTVLADNRGGARAATAHLIAHGHRRIAFLADAPGIYTAALRRDGYRDALASAGIPADDDLVAMEAPLPGAVRAALRAFDRLGHPPTALVTGNNRTTVEVLRALAQAPVRPAIVGFDDFELADLMTPPVTVVAQDPVGMGRAAARSLFRRLAGDDSPAHRIELPTRLIVRGSGETPPPDPR